MENGLGGTATSSPCSAGHLACPYGAHKFGGSSGQSLKLTVKNNVVGGSTVYSINS